MCIPGAVLRFNDECLLMLAEAWESAEGVATVSGRMVLTRRQLRETYHLGKGGPVRKMPGWQEDGDLTFATEEAADARQLFLTERVVERRLDDLYVSPDGVPGACLVRARDSRKPPSRGALRDGDDVCAVIAKRKYDADWNNVALEDRGPWMRSNAEVFSPGDPPVPRVGATGAARIARGSMDASGGGGGGAAAAALAAVAEKRRLKTEGSGEPKAEGSAEPEPMDIDGATKKEKRRRVDLLRDDDGDDEGAADGDDGEEYEPEKKIRKKSFVDVVRSGTDQGRPESAPESSREDQRAP